MEGNKFERSIPIEKRRNFLGTLNNLGENSGQIERKNLVQVGDYLDIPYQTFSTWFQSEITDKNESREGKPSLVRVSVLEILDNGKIIIQTGNMQKEIEASLFFNYNK